MSHRVLAFPSFIFHSKCVSLL